MANEYYVAEDGSIHRYPVHVVNNTENRTNTFDPVPADAHSHTRTAYRQDHRVSKGRIIWFWIISIIIALLVAVGINQRFGAEIYGSAGGFIAAIGPFVVFVGALAGSILYGIFCAKSVDYNLWAYILSALSSVGGIAAVGIAVAIIYFIVMILIYILAIGIAIAIICGIAGGS